MPTAPLIFARSSNVLAETGGGIDGLVLTAPRPITTAASATEERTPVRVTAKRDLGTIGAMALAIRARHHSTSELVTSLQSDSSELNDGTFFQKIPFFGNF